MRIKDGQFDQFIKPAFNIFRKILDPSMEYNIIVVPQGNHKAKQTAIVQLKNLAKDQRALLDDMLYKAILDMSEAQSPETDADIETIGTEIVKLFFLRQREVKIKNQLPMKKKMQIALSFGRGEKKEIAAKYLLIKISAIGDALMPYFVIATSAAIGIVVAVSLWQHHIWF